jgi:hypothetical protein
MSIYQLAQSAEAALAELSSRHTKLEARSKRLERKVAAFRTATGTGNPEGKTYVEAVRVAPAFGYELVPLAGLWAIRDQLTGNASHRRYGFAHAHRIVGAWIEADRRAAACGAKPIRLGRDGQNHIDPTQW